jgi:hypothetical protein
VGAGLSHPQHFEVASALLCVIIIGLMDAIAKCAIISSQPTNRRSEEPFPGRHHQ